MSLPTFDLIVPVLNEADALPDFFARLQKLKLNCRPIFVDNASTDGSLALLKNYPGATVIEHKTNEGYGSSIIDGINAGNNDRIVIIDADGEYPLECIPDLLVALQNNPAVYASRLLSKHRHETASMGLLKASGNKLISLCFNRLFDQCVTDLYTGCKALNRACLNGITLEQKGFEHVLELSAKLAARQYKIAEIAVDYTSRQTGTSKMRHLPETAKYFYWLLVYARLSRAGKL